MWNDLSMRDRALLIRLAVSLGITNLDDILQSYDQLATGGPKDNKDIKQWVLDDMARRIEAVENDKSNKEGGWNARKGVWEPHTSVEGGANTIHYGIKLVPANKEIVDLVKKQGYITNDLGWDYLKRTRLSNDYDTARKTFNTYNKDALALDSLSPKMLSILTDYQFNVGNGGLSVFKNLMNAAYNNDLEGLNREYKRYTGGLELTRNKHIKNELDSILNGFYNIMTEKPIEEDNSDVSDVYTDGKLMEYVKAMEESNSKTLPMTTPYNDGNIIELVKSLPHYKGTPMTTPYNDGWLPGKKADGGPIIQIVNRFDGTKQPTQQMDRGNQPLYDGQIGFGFGYNPETFERYYTGFYNPYNNSYNNATWVDENDEYNIGLPTVTIRPSGESMVNRAQEKAAPVVRDVLLGSAALAGGITALANAASKVPFSALKPGGAFWTNPLTVGTLAAEGINTGVKAVTPYNSVGDIVGSTLEKITGANPNNTWIGPIFTEAFNPGWYVSPTGIINTVGKIGNIVESKLPAIQKALSRNPLPSYAYEDILKSKFYESLVKEYGEDTATEIAKEISTPEVQRFIIGDNPRTAYKAGKKHAKLMQIIKEVENAGGLLAGSGQLAKHGTVNRNGLLHDLDFNIPGDIITKESPLFDLPGYYSAPRISRRFPFIGKKVMGSNSKGYVNVPHIRLGQYLDMFIKPEMPTEDNIINTILEGKKLFGRPKDVADIATFRPYSVDNPMIDITTGEGQWNPTLFDRGIFTEEGYPFVLTVELYPGSKIKVPVMMNYEGQIKTVGGINNIITDNYGFNSFVDRLKNSGFPHWSTISDKDLLNTALNLLIKKYPFVGKIEGNLGDRLKKVSVWDLDKSLSNLEHVPTDYERRMLTRFMEIFPDEQINEDILKVLQLKYTDDNVNDILNRIANKDFDFRIFDHSIDIPSKYSESVDLQIREALANYEYAPYYKGRYTTPLYIMDDFKDLENLIKAYKNGEKLPYEGMYTLEHGFDYLNPEAPQLLKDIAKKTGLIPDLITKNKVPINLEDGMIIYPGYLLKSLMAGNTLEKLLSKTGNININNIKSLANKASNIEKEIINKVLSSDLFANKTTINYNDFKKAILDQLIEYDLESSDKWANYGMHSVGLTDPETIILSNKNIPKANASTHFKENSLGHFRIAKSKDEPNIMYVLENQSDWGLARYYDDKGKAFNRRRYEEKYLKNVDEDTKKQLLAEARDREKQFLTPEQIFLKNEFERKLTLEILLLAALRKMSLVRFPTRDVAAKIEGFNKILEPGVNERIQTAFENGNITFELYELMLNELKTFPQYQEKVLLKYDNFPNLFKKWFKNSDVRSYMDANSNLWYEVDVPQDYLYQEWPYANGGKIHIKPSKRGTFTAAAKKHGKSVQAFASLVLANPSRYSAAMRKKANFARNAAKWHSYGGPIIYKHLGLDKRK